MTVVSTQVMGLPGEFKCETVKGMWGIFRLDQLQYAYPQPESTKETELERLVRVANDGVNAAMIIDRKYTGLVEDISEPCGGGKYEYISYRIKLNPAFEPFYVGPPCNPNIPNSRPGWLVKLEGGDTLHVGCKSLPAWLAAQHLRCFLQGNESERTMSNLDQTEMFATKNGIKISGQGTISWADADRILAALEKAGVK
jgi:hypothetical protein